jgi:transposase
MKSYFLGGDASKGYCDFTLLDQKQRIVEDNFQLDDCHEGHQWLCQFLKKFFSHNNDAIIYAGFESTGGYENNWYQLFWKLQEDFNIKVAQVNPFSINHHKKASLERIDTDKISAQKIAEYLIKYPEKVAYSKEDCFAGMRRHWKFVRMIKKQKAQQQTALKAQLYVAHPQLLIHCTEGIRNWVLHLLTKYPTAARLANADDKEVADIPRISKERAKELISDAKLSVASLQDSSMEDLIRFAAQNILNLKKAIDQQEKMMASTYDFPEIEILISFKGIDHYSAFGLMLEIVAIERYVSVKQLVSFFGIHPKWRQSGDGVSGMHMSKKGRKEPRWILFNVALSAIAHDEMMRKLYEGYQARGKCKMSAVGIIMHKVLRIIYGMLKHKKEYDPDVDIANRKNACKKKETASPKPNKNRRFQNYNQKAPISRRQTKKRNEYIKEEVMKMSNIESKHKSIQLE